MKNYTKAGKAVFPIAVEVMEINMRRLEEENIEIDFQSLFRLYREAMFSVNAVALHLYNAASHPIVPREIVRCIAEEAVEIALLKKNLPEPESDIAKRARQAAVKAVTKLYNREPLKDVKSHITLVLAAYRVAIKAADAVYERFGYSPFYDFSDPEQKEKFKRFWGISEDVLIASFRGWTDPMLSALGRRKYQLVMGK